VFNLILCLILIFHTFCYIHSVPFFFEELGFCVLYPIYISLTFRIYDELYFRGVQCYIYCNNCVFICYRCLNTFFWGVFVSFFFITFIENSWLE